MPDGRILCLPIRALAGTKNGIASLILNQSSFEVEAVLADFLAGLLKPSKPDVIVGMPTLGLSLARLVAMRLGQTRYIALGTSRKFWYDDALSVPVSSITSPNTSKRLYADPRMLPLLTNRRVCLIDDVISSGSSILAALELLTKISVQPVSIGAAMLQTQRWMAKLSENYQTPANPICAPLVIPLLEVSDFGWNNSKG